MSFKVFDRSLVASIVKHTMHTTKRDTQTQRRRDKERDRVFLRVRAKYVRERERRRFWTFGPAKNRGGQPREDCLCGGLFGLGFPYSRVYGKANGLARFVVQLVVFVHTYLVSSASDFVPTWSVRL
jgi:hypothetical protein